MLYFYSQTNVQKNFFHQHFCLFSHKVYKYRPLSNTIRCQGFVYHVYIAVVLNHNMFWQLNCQKTLQLMWTFVDGCVYNGMIYQQNQMWDDGCKYTCECLDASTGRYSCTEKYVVLKPFEFINKKAEIIISTILHENAKNVLLIRPIKTFFIVESC